jgi:GNAT superfamily N-acetyltransferase
LEYYVERGTVNSVAQSSWPVFGTRVDFRQIDPRADAAGFQACFDLFDAAQLVDDPNFPPFALNTFWMWWAEGWAGTPQEIWLGFRDGEPVGCYLLELPETENTSMGFARPVVPPALRRRGLGTELLEHCKQRAMAHGRETLAAEVIQGSAAAQFSAASGATEGSVASIRRILKLDDPDLPVRLAPLREQAAAKSAGYQLVCWSGRTPEELLPGLVEVEKALADAPIDAGVEHPLYDESRLRREEENAAANGVRRHYAATMSADTGAMAAYSGIAVDMACKEWAFQMLTGVTRPHRGHRLGLVTKLAMLDYLAVQEPDVRTIVTSNAELNEHMVAINEAMGFEISDRFGTWRLDLRRG